MIKQNVAKTQPIKAQNISQKRSSELHVRSHLGLNMELRLNY
jgi:hypothetical protein